MAENETAMYEEDRRKVFPAIIYLNLPARKEH